MEQRLWISASDVFVCSEGDQRPPRKLGAVIPRSCEVRSDESSLKEMIPPPPTFLKLRTRALEMLLVVALCVCHAVTKIPDFIPTSPMTLVCPRCGAKPGQACASLKGQQELVHVERIEAATAQDRCGTQE